MRGRDNVVGGGYENPPSFAHDLRWEGPTTRGTAWPESRTPARRHDAGHQSAHWRSNPKPPVEPVSPAPFAPSAFVGSSHQIHRRAALILSSMPEPGHRSFSTS